MLKIERAPAHAPVTWLLIGGGAQYEKLARDARQRGVTSLQLKPYQPRERLSESLSTADVHLISLRPELEGLIVPSKFYGVAAAGRASIYIGDGDGEIARTIKRLDAGLCVPFGDAAALAEAVLWLAAHPGRCREMGQRARLALEREFDKAIAVDRWRRLLSEIQGQCEVPTAERLRSPTNKRHDRSREPVQQKR
jgi:glycosyltransferase involved in cell wall biosynthesis